MLPSIKSLLREVSEDPKHTPAPSAQNTSSKRQLPLEPLRADMPRPAPPPSARASMYEDPRSLAGPSRENILGSRNSRAFEASEDARSSSYAIGRSSHSLTDSSRGSGSNSLAETSPLPAFMHPPDRQLYRHSMPVNGSSGPLVRPSYGNFKDTRSSLPHSFAQQDSRAMRPPQPASLDAPVFDLSQRQSFMPNSFSQASVLRRNDRGASLLPPPVKEFTYSAPVAARQDQGPWSPTTTHSPRSVHSMQQGQQGAPTNPTSSVQGKVEVWTSSLPHNGIPQHDSGLRRADVQRDRAYSTGSSAQSTAGHAAPGSPESTTRSCAKCSATGFVNVHAYKRHMRTHQLKVAITFNDGITRSIERADDWTGE